MGDITPRKTIRTISIACVIATAFLYFIVYPTILYINPPKDDSLLITSKLKMLHLALLMYKSDQPLSRFPTKADMESYDNDGLLKDNDLTVLGNPEWPAEPENVIVAVSRIMEAVPSPSAYGCFFGGIRGWPATDIPARRLQLHANGKISICR